MHMRAKSISNFQISYRLRTAVIYVRCDSVTAVTGEHPERARTTGGERREGYTPACEPDHDCPVVKNSMTFCVAEMLPSESDYEVFDPHQGIEEEAA